MRIVIDSNNPDAIIVDREGVSRPDPADLASITRRLNHRLNRDLPGTFLKGKTTMRDEVMDMLDCSALKAERIVDTLVARGHAQFRRATRTSQGPAIGRWRLAPTDGKS